MSLVGSIKGLFGKRKLLKSNLGNLFPELGFFSLEDKVSLEKKLNLKINHIRFYEQAFTHRSLLTEEKEKRIFSNQRLEFFGDSILGMIIGEYLFETLPEGREGDLTKLRSAYVNNSTLAKCADHLEIQEYLLLGQHAERTFDKGFESIMSDAMEALVAAIYYDQGFQITKNFVLDKVLPVMENHKHLVHKNYKSILLEKFQAEQKPVPKYDVLDESGPDHNKEFTIGVYLEDKLIGTGTGKSKKSAEQDAAFNALENL